MDTIARRAFFGVAGLGAVAAAAATAEGADETGEYGGLGRPIVVGLGRGQAVSLTFVWLPRDGGSQRSSLKARPGHLRPRRQGARPERRGAGAVHRCRRRIRAGVEQAARSGVRL